MTLASIPVLFARNIIQNGMAKEPEYYRRNMPHWQPSDGVYHLVMRLYGSLPRAVVLRLQQEHQRRVTELEQSGFDELECKMLLRQEQEFYFGKFDALLDAGQTGPKWLKDDWIATAVRDCFLYWHEKQHFKLVALSVMPNHIHAIAYKIQRPLFRILQTIKTYTAKQANEMLFQHGTHFWQRETYDHLIRNRKEFENQIRYVLMNPVKAGLVQDWKDWEFTWLNADFRAVW